MEDQKQKAEILLGMELVEPGKAMHYISFLIGGAERDRSCADLSKRNDEDREYCFAIAGADYGSSMARMGVKEYELLNGQRIDSEGKRLQCAPIPARCRDMFKKKLDTMLELAR